jgi:hypothetical protein
VHLGARDGTVSIGLRILNLQGSAFKNAISADLHLLIDTVTKAPGGVSKAGFLSVGGLRLAEVAYTRRNTQYVLFVSGRDGRYFRILAVRVACPTRKWPERRTIATAVIDSLKTEPVSIVEGAVVGDRVSGLSIEFSTQAGVIVARAVTDRAGHYRVELTPDTYAISLVRTPSHPGVDTSKRWFGVEEDRSLELSISE